MIHLQLDPSTILNELLLQLRIRRCQITLENF